MPDLRSYGAVLVDLDGTLYRQRPVRLLMAIELLVMGWSAIAVLRAFRRSHEEVRLAERLERSSPYEEQLRLTAARLGVAEARVRAIVEDWMVRRPMKWLGRFARKELLQELANYRSAGGKLALVSDYPATQKALAFSRWTHFDVVVSSGEAGGPARLKPHPEGYLTAAERVGVLPAHCLVIGDREDADGDAARAAGMGFHLVC